MADNNAMRLHHIIKQMVDTNFRQSWQFRLEIKPHSGEEIENLDFFIKDVSYEYLKVDTDRTEAGTITANHITKLDLMSVSMTMREDEKRTVTQYWKKMVGRMFNADGTVNHPDNYLIDIHRYSLLGDGPAGVVPGSEELTDTWKNMIFVPSMQITESVSESGFLEFPVTFEEFWNVDRLADLAA